MRTALQFHRFLVAWSLVSLLDAALDGYAGESPSLACRSGALGALLLLASTTHCLKMPPSVLAAIDGEHSPGAVYAALLIVLGLPGLTLRLVTPLDLAGLQGLHHGASITFAFGVLTLLIARVAPSVGRRRSLPNGRT